MNSHAPDQTPAGPRALSLHRPWAWLIIHAGKDIENRTWHTPYRGPVILHSARPLNTAILAELAHRHGSQAARQAAFIGFVGVADLQSIHPATACAGGCSPWAEPTGMHWVFADPRPFRSVIPGLGSRGLFDPLLPVLIENARLAKESA